MDDIFTMESDLLQYCIKRTGFRISQKTYRKVIAYNITEQVSLIYPIFHRILGHWTKSVLDSNTKIIHDTLNR